MPVRPFHYVKSHGLGNDYLVVEPAALPAPITLGPDSVRVLCDRHRGIGGDGILEHLGRQSGSPGVETFGLRIWNPDGSEAEKSGNGLRIFAKYLYEHGHTTATAFTIATATGPAAVTLVLATGSPPCRVVAVTVDMGRAVFAPRQELTVAGRAWPVTVVSVGNPHCVVVVPDLAAIELARLGPRFETHPAFPARTNVQFVTPLDRQRVRALIWERGAGETLASGSSSCAIAAACHHRGLTGREVTVLMAGGELRVRLDEGERLWLTGPAEEVCRGTLSSELLARLVSGS